MNKKVKINGGNSVGIVKTKFFNFAEKPDELVLSNGIKLGPITVAYETYGELNNKKSNAILVFHALSGDSHAAGYNSPDDTKPGWWDMMIGPGKPFDTKKFFIVCANVIGGCKGSTGPASINPETGSIKLPFERLSPDTMIKATPKAAPPDIPNV